MSEFIAKGLDEEPLMTAALASRPQDNIFRSFNALNPRIFDDLLGNLRSVTRGDISEYLTIVSDGSKFSSSYQEHSSTFESRHEFSLSMGVEGSYGVFSASANRESETVETSSFTSLFSSYSAELHMGTISLNALSPAEQLGLLRPEMVTQLKAIVTLADARNFTERWGTHLITRVNTGGIVFVSNSVETESHDKRESVSYDMKVSYQKVASLEVAISTSNEIKQGSENVMQTIRVRGGDAHKAAAINPADRSTIRAWVDSVSTDTTFAVVESVEIFSLVDGLARTMLKKYIDLTMLAFSLQNPVIFATGTGIRARQNITVTAAPVRFGNDFKVIGGGAGATKGSNNFLMGSYPQSRDARPPAAWIASSHDLRNEAVATDVLTSYAIAIHDPGNYIDVTVAEGRGTNTKIGADRAEATLPDGWILTAGGVFSRTLEGAHKFVTATYFKDAKTWAVASSDYKTAAINVELRAFAIGIKSKDPLLTIEVDKQAGTEERGQHGRPTAVGRGPVCGGGVLVSGNSGAGNLVQQCLPSEPRIWKGVNSDLDGSVSPASSQAFALSLHARVLV